MTQRLQEHIDQVMTKLREFGMAGEAAVILMGSAARGALTGRSDTDILIVTRAPLPKWHIPIDLHLHAEPRDRFIEKLMRRDDFPGWALRYGKVLHDPLNWWQQLRELGATVWPDWRPKVDHAAKRRAIAVKALTDGDRDAAEEEYLLTASHLARAVLLRARTFPLSRPELPQQLRALGRTKLAEALSALMSDALGLNDLREVARVVEQELEVLAREADRAAAREIL